MPAKFNVAPEVRAVLEKATITADKVVLPTGQLARPLYVAVNKVLEGAGGKWNRKAGAHLFPSDPRELLGLAVETGVATDKKTELQAFYTPSTIAERVARAAMLDHGMSVLEPSAGHGGLAHAAIEVAKVRVTCVEIDPVAVKILQGHGFDVHEADFLKLTPGHLGEEFDRIMMNPPFTKGQDIDHVMHALDFLKPAGRLVAIVSGNTLDGTTKKHAAFKAKMKEFSISAEALPEGAFRESGTNVKTAIVAIKRRTW